MSPAQIYEILKSLIPPEKQEEKAKLLHKGKPIDINS